MINLIIINLLTLLIIHYIGTNLFVHIRSKKQQIFLFVISLILISSINLRGINNIFSSLFLTIIYFLYIFLGFHGSKPLKLLTIIFVCLSMAISEFISASIVNLIEPLSRFNYSYVIGLYLTMFLLLLESSAYIHISKLFLEYFSVRKFWTILILPFFTFLIVLGINHNFSSFIKNGLSIFYLVFCVIGIYSANFILLNYYINFLKNTKLEYELKLEKHTNKDLNLKFEYLNKYYLSKFSFLHNMLHSLNELYTISKSKDYDKLDTKIDILSQQVSKEFNLLYSNSKALGTILSEKMEYIFENNIEIETKINEDLTFLSLNDQLLLFSELFEYCLDLPQNQFKNKPFIMIKTERINNYYLLKINCNFKLTKDINNLIARLNSLSIIPQIEKKYNPNLNIDCLMITFEL